MAKKQRKVQETICKICTKIIKGPLCHVRAHLFTHREIPARFKCHICRLTFYRIDHYNSHLRNCIKSQNGSIKSQNGSIKYSKCICDYCNKEFHSKITILRHIRMAHDSSIKGHSKKTFSCVACKKTYTERRMLLHHAWKEHFDTPNNTEPTYLRKSVNDCWVEKMKDTFVQIKKVKNNMLMIKKCEIKPETFEVKKEVTKTVSSNVLLNYSTVTCDYCKREMLKKCLVKHIREVHLNIRYHQCRSCKKAFKRPYMLRDHYKRKSFKCNTTKISKCNIVRPNNIKKKVVKTEGAQGEA